MRILFTLTGNGSRSNYVTGENMRYNKAGLSGTDTSTILVAEYLANNGYEVIVAVEKPEGHVLDFHQIKGNSFTPGTVDRNVTYTYLDLENIENKNF
jgi:hypothetical protein